MSRDFLKVGGLPRRFGVDAQLAHLGLQRGALHAEFGGGAGVPADLAPSVVQRALDGFPLGSFQGDDARPRPPAVPPLSSPTGTCRALPVVRITARSMKFCSSRMLPGQ